MKAIILDMDMVFLRELDGKSENGIYIWLDERKRIPYLNWEFGGVEKTAPVSFNDRVALTDCNVIIYLFDGKDYHQAKIHELKEKYPQISYMNYSQFIKYLKGSRLVLEPSKVDDKSYKDYDRDKKLLALTKKAMLTRPSDTLKTIMNILFIIVALISVFATWWNANNSASSSKPTLESINQSNSNFNLFYKADLNRTALIYSYIQSHCGGISYNSLPTTP